MIVATAVVAMIAAVTAAIQENLATGSAAWPAALVLLGVAGVVCAGLWQAKGTR